MTFEMPHEDTHDTSVETPVQTETLETEYMQDAPPPDEPVTTYKQKNNRRKPFNPVVYVLLLAVVLIGAYFRFTGQNWDDYTHLHPDERFLTGVAESLNGAIDPNAGGSMSDTIREAHRQLCIERYPETNGAATSIFDSFCSTMYPKNANNGTGLYVYGELPLFIMRWSAELTRNSHLSMAEQTPDPNDDVVARNWLQYNGIHLVGRSMSAVADTLSILFVFLIGRRLYNKWIGLMAAAFYAAAVLPIQLSHFWTTDAFTNLPVTIAFWFAVRAMDRGKWYEFAFFGIALGAAMASRINVLFLIGVGFLAAIIYGLPSFDASLIGSERRRAFLKTVQAFVLIVFFTGLSFRIFNPHAFVGGPGILGFFNIGNQSALDELDKRVEQATGVPPEKRSILEYFLYGPFLEDMKQAQLLSSGEIEFPPNYQWTNRTPYVFPGRNIILWGMGVPLGLMGWIGWIWALIQVIRARPLWTRHILSVAWILVYFGYMGRQWVTTMRYFTPLYPFLAILAAWTLYELVTRSWRAMQDNPTAVRRIAYAGATFLMVFVIAATFLWATMFVRIHQRQLTRVEASRWILANIPSAVSVNLTLPNGRDHLVNMGVNGSLSLNISRYDTPDPKLTPFVPTSAVEVDRVLISNLVNAQPDEDIKRFNVAITASADGSQILAHGNIESNFSPNSNSAFGAPYTVMLQQPVSLDPALTYYLMTWTDGDLVITRNDQDNPADFVLSNANGDRLAQVRLPDVAIGGDITGAKFASAPAQAQFRAPADGTIKTLTFAHVMNLLGTDSDATIQATLYGMTEQGEQEVGRGTLSADFTSTEMSPFGDSYILTLDNPVEAKKDQSYRIDVASLSGTPLQIAGSVVSNEGGWDDPLPWKVCPLPPEIELNHDTPSGILPVTCEGVDGFTWYRGFEMHMTLEDDQEKRGLIQKTLDQSDYFSISSNRNYDTLSRMPLRFPMSMAYYKALFRGELGYDLVKVVSSFPSIGNFEIADQNLPIYNSPDWVNEWESEEAFSVYDHPTVFIFKRRPDYNSAKVASVLSVPITSAGEIDSAVIYGEQADTKLINRITWSSKDASRAPMGFFLNEEQRAIQTQGGTWSELFNRNWLINQSEVVSTIIWWLAMLVFGWAAWPTVYAILPGLPDRGYPIIKIAGLLIVSWVVWAGGTLKLLTWSQPGILLTLIGLALFSAYLAVRNRGTFIEYLRLNWRHMLIVELITLVLFLGFLFVKIGNPDLWAQNLGGEKPMDFAYFNGVLRSTIFPPYDPWFGGGYLNYYYYGYVLVGTPVKLLGVMPQVAYNLIIPTLFSLTGMAAFCAAFNLAASRWFFVRDEGTEDGETARERRRFALRTPGASPYLAGVLAILLCVVLGNLDTPRTVLSGLTRAGGYSDSLGMYDWKLQQFQTENSRPPDPEEELQLRQEAENPSLTDRIRFGLQDSQRMIDGLGRGIEEILKGGVLPVGQERWFWGPTRVMGEQPNASNEIAEMPYFTFIFADLHAHMIAFPLTLLAIVWVISEVLAASSVIRHFSVAIGSILFGGLIIGTLQPTNTWDWFTYIVLGIFGLIFAVCLRYRRFGRRIIVAFIAQVGGLFAAQALFALPFTTYWASSYVGSGNTVISFEGTKTPIWVYFSINGLFLYIIISYLLWQTIRLLRRLYVRDLAGKALAILLLILVIGVTVVASLIIANVTMKISLLSMPIPLAAVLLPLLAWCAILFFIPDQSREHQIVYALIGLALGISFGVEMVVLGADIGRQNTFFKFYLQIWILFSVTAGVMLAWLLSATQNWQSGFRAVWLGFLAILMATGAMFTIMSTQGRNALRMAVDAPNKLDGLAYMDYATYYEGSIPMPLGDDLKMIQWLQDNVKGTPVILEAYASEYKLGARIANATGFPTIIGWRFHQSQQRTIEPLPNLTWQRIANVSAMYNSTDIATVWRMLKFFNIEYIVVGKFESGVYSPEGKAKWDQMVEQGLLEVVYDDRGDKIYHVVPGATLPDVVVRAR